MNPHPVTAAPEAGTSPAGHAGGAQNVDPVEAARYAALADLWWDRTGPFWPLHRLNELRTEFLRTVFCEHLGRDPAASAPFAGLRALDVGCGGGILSESLAALGAEVHGIDVVEKNIAVARRHAQTSGLAVHYDVTEAEHLAATGARYDLVLNMEVVEHVPDPAGLLAACADMVRPGGLMAVATINRTLKAWLFAIVGAEYVLRWLPRGTHQWRAFVTPEETRSALEGRGMTSIRQAGVSVNPFTRGFRVTPSLAVNYMVVAHRPEPGP